MSPHIASDLKFSTTTNLACSALCNKLPTFQYSSNKHLDPGSVDNIESSTVYVDDESLPLAYDATSDYMGFNHLAHIKGEKAVVGVIYPVTATTNFSIF